MKSVVYFLAALTTTSLLSFGQADPQAAPPPAYQPPPGYKLVPIDTPPAQPAPAPQPAQPAPAPQPVYQPPVYQPPASTPPPATYAQPVYQPAPPVAVPVVINRMSDAEIDSLTSSVALYPDPLLALILPASSYPLEVGAASQWARLNPGAPQYVIDAQPWQPSVKALVHYPTVLDTMAARPDWTQRLGAAFLNQPGDVTNSIQRLRFQAQAAGTLFSTPQQQVVTDSGMIRIVPADPTLVYVPTYDPAVVYVRHERPVVGITFGHGFTIGAWLNYDVDWHSHWVVVGPRWDHHDVQLVREPWRRDVIVHDDHHFDDHHDDHHDWRH